MRKNWKDEKKQCSCSWRTLRCRSSRFSANARNKRHTKNLDEVQFLYESNDKFRFFTNFFNDLDFFISSSKKLIRGLSFTASRVSEQNKLHFATKTKIRRWLHQFYGYANRLVLVIELTLLDLYVRTLVNPTLLLGRSPVVFKKRWTARKFFNMPTWQALDRPL